jgi:hypothetical protein
MLLPVVVAIAIRLFSWTLFLSIVLLRPCGSGVFIILVSIGTRLVAFPVILLHGPVIRSGALVIPPCAFVLWPRCIFVFVLCLLVLRLWPVTALL